MHNVNATTTSPSPVPNVTLSTVFCVRADRSYDVCRGPCEPEMFELFRTLSGDGRIEMNGIPSVEVSSNTLLIANRDRITRYLCTSETWTFWWFRFRMERPPDLPCHQLLNIPGALSDEQQSNQCLALLKEDSPPAAACASSYLALLLAKWAREWRRAISANPHQEAIDRITNMMHSMREKRLTVKRMAEVACLSVRRFRQVFEESTGLPPKKYFDRMRMETASEMLRTTPCSISLIADQLGYSSQFHFSKAFKAHFGIAPREYR